MKNKRKILLNPGPVTLTSRVRQSLLKEDLCHRENSFSLLLKSVKSKLLKVYDLDDDFDAVILAGSGTAAVEAMLKSFVKDHDKSLILSNGGMEREWHQCYKETIKNLPKFLMIG